MPYAVILAHPRPGSFNHALAHAACAALGRLGAEVRLHDLYAEGFDPLLEAPEMGRDAPLSPSLSLHCREIAAAEGIVIVHPNWWGMPPAILTGWVDRVMRPGVAYEFLEGDNGEGVPRGLLSARGAVVLNTSNTAREREVRVFGDPLERIWKDCVFGLCGVADVRRRMFETVVTSSPGTRQEWLRQTEALILETFSVS
ncbi:NAD(P)H dehydrogenase (quinone) [Solidesulfovibrio fructosivorans JJ]]|uniref:NAD(P)H dehydrogenase (Quinone) n=1 Tax=Solidesulfovibrio fructosivorans JJ] TaxID=596151 RepID=E1JW52_SOLFR|nr:NAD(P)H-dependent oxidoreductase [Solidesulfovibrio fructosivorans]EFL51412.1 NAD(P)H dehydrogenase (quinone) [Solidesulfovibrio fructosivorans JJ]]